MSSPYIIAITGGTASGKTSVANAVISSLQGKSVAHISLDSFYKTLSVSEIEAANRNEYNFDCPEAFDLPLLLDTLQKIKLRSQVEIPYYDFSTHSRTSETTILDPVDVVVFEGIFVLHWPLISNQLDLRVFVDTDSDIRLARRLKRDVAERGRDVIGVLQQYNRFVKPGFDKYVQPSLRDADMILLRGMENSAGIDMVLKHILRVLNQRNP